MGMCGRYSLTKKEMRLALQEVAEMILTLLTFERYNIAPTQLAPVILQESGNISVRQMRWGLQPSWSKAPYRLRRYARSPVMARPSAINQDSAIPCN